MRPHKQTYWKPFLLGFGSLVFSANVQANSPLHGPTFAESIVLPILFFLALFVIEVTFVYVLLARWFRFGRFVGVYLLTNVVTWSTLVLIQVGLGLGLRGLTIVELFVVLAEAAVLVWLSRHSSIRKRGSTRLSWAGALGASAAGNTTSLLLGLAFFRRLQLAVPILWTMTVIMAMGAGLRCKQTRE